MMIRHVLIALIILFATTGGVCAQSCSFSVSNVDFGNVDTLSGGAVDTSATVDISCTAGLLDIEIAVCLNINAGLVGATSGIRHMRNTARDPLDYNLYQDAARTVPWGSREQPALGNPVRVTLFLLPLTTVSTSRTIYGRLFANQQSAPSGPYGSTFSGAEVTFNWSQYLLIPPSCSTVTQNPQRPSFVVQANIPDNCVVAAQDIDFGSHGVLDSAVDSDGQVDVTCTQATTYSIGLDNGLNGDDPITRRMSLAGQSVIYGLYKDVSRSQPWGDSGGNLVAGTGIGAVQSVPVHGRVPAQSTPSPGTYSDTVVVTVTY